MKQPRNALGSNKPLGRIRPARPPHILLTGFGPFPGVPINPTQRIVAAAASRLARMPGHGIVVTEILPTEWAMLARLPTLLARHRPDVVVMTGVAVRARSARIEQTAHARAETGLADARGAKLKIKSGLYAHRAARHTEVDVARLRTALSRANLRNVAQSDDPGAYLCNAAYLTALDWSRTQAPRPPVVFIHVPEPGLRPGARERDLVELVVRTATKLAHEPLRRGAVRPI